MSSANIDINANAINYGLWINEFKKMFALPSSFLLQSNVWKYYLTCIVFTSYNSKVVWSGRRFPMFIDFSDAAFNNQKMRGRKSCLRLKQFRNITWRQASNFLLVHNCFERFRMTEVGALCRQFVRPAYCIFFLICDKNIVFARVCNFAKIVPGRKETSFV